MKQQLRSALLTTRFARSALGTSLMTYSALLAMGCEGSAPRDLGSSSIQLSGAAETEPQRPRDFIGTWVGVAPDVLELTDTEEAAPLPFPSGSSKISLIVHGDGVFSDRFASLTFGEAEPPPTPTDPDAPPPGIPPEFLDGVPENTPPLEGFPYALNPRSEVGTGNFGIGLNDYDLVDGIMRMGFYADEIFEDYCRLPTEAIRPMCVDCGPDGNCQANVYHPIELWVRRTPTGLAGFIHGRLDVFNPRGALTSLGQIRFTREE
jgi:hypothetical protein